MRVCVTGGAGYIGSHTCKLLAKQGWEVVVYDNLSRGHRDFVKWGEFEYGDIRDAARLRQVLRKYRPDGVIHFAAYIEVGESVANHLSFYSNNVVGSLNVLDAMVAEGVKNIVASSSCAVYGIPEHDNLHENSPKNPINPYGESKLFMEKMLRDAGNAHGIRWMSLRYFNAAGASEDGEIGELHFPETHLIPRIMAAAKGFIPAIDIYGTDYPTPDGTCIRDYIHVDDLARAHALGLAFLANGGESLALNLGTETGSSVREVIDGISQIAGREIPVNTKTRRPGDPPKLVANASLAKNTLGWQAELGLPQILKSAWNFMDIRQEQFGNLLS